MSQPVIVLGSHLPSGPGTPLAVTEIDCAEKIAAVRLAMQPTEQDQTYPLGSFKGRQQRIKNLHKALHTHAVPEPSLDDLNGEQLDALLIALDGLGLYVTGAAGMSLFTSRDSLTLTLVGTGKTHLFYRIYEALVYQHGYPPAVAMTASTGMAASRVQGNLT